MKRRTFITFAAVAPTLALLSACGFQLRGPQEFVFSTIAVTPGKGNPLVQELLQHLGERVRPAVSAPGAEPPQVTLELLQAQREKTVVGINASGQVREFDLTVRVRFRLRNAAGRELIPETEIIQTRNISFSESAVLAKEAEEGLLYRDMQTDIVRQLLRRLSRVKDV